jgi:methionyl-tRNA formyltransferase
MKIAVLGRTRWLVEAGDLLRQAGHAIVAVATAQAEPFYKCGPEEFELLSLRCKADYLGVVSLSDPAIRARLAAAQAELAVSINWPVVLGANVLDLFPRGVLNVHCGDLPRYRGNACANWAILNGEARIGLCVHMMTPGEVDAGPILLRDYLPISDATYIGDVYAWLDRRVPALLSDAASGFARGEIAPVPQPDDPMLALRCYPRRPEDGRIDWREPVARVHRLVRASSRPFAGAFAYLEDGHRVTIWRARPFACRTPFCAVPGQVMLRFEGDPVIACGAGALRLEEVEVEGVAPDDSKPVVGRSLRARLT